MVAPISTRSSKRPPPRLARAQEASSRVSPTSAAVLHLRCGFFFTDLLLQLDDLRAGEVQVALPTDRPMAWVPPADVARVAAAWLLRPDWSGRRVQAVHGPVDLSWDDALAVVSDVTGHPVRARQVADDDVRAASSGAGMSPRQVEAVLGMSTFIRDGFVPEPARDATTMTPTTLAAWSTEVLRPLLLAS